jgi:hypothetical protein
MAEGFRHPHENLLAAHEIVVGRPAEMSDEAWQRVVNFLVARGVDVRAVPQERAEEGGPPLIDYDEFIEDARSMGRSEKIAEAVYSALANTFRLFMRRDRADEIYLRFASFPDDLTERWAVTDVSGLDLYSLRDLIDSIDRRIDSGERADRVYESFGQSIGLAAFLYCRWYLRHKLA